VSDSGSNSFKIHVDVQTVGMMPADRVWLDSTGGPISDAARVEERWHRVNVSEMYCSPYELEQYNKRFAQPGSRGRR